MNTVQFIKDKNILYELVSKNIKAQYRNSILGVLWTVLNPLLNMLVMWFVFSSFFGAGDPDYALYLLCGNLVFNFIRNATYPSTSALVDNSGLLTKVKITYSIFPLANNFSALVNFAFSFIALIGVMLVNFLMTPGASGFSFTMLLTLIMLPALLLFTYGLSLILSAIFVFFRDIKHFYDVFLTLLMYITPIFYKLNNIAEGSSLIKTVIYLNPAYYFVSYFRNVIYGCQYQLPAFLGNGSWMILFLYAIGCVCAGLGLLFFNATKKRFILYI